MRGHSGIRGGMGGDRVREWRLWHFKGSMYVYKGTFLYRENGLSMHSNNTETEGADGPGPLYCSHNT